MSTAFSSQNRDGICIERRERRDLEAISMDAANELIDAVEEAARRQKSLGCGDPSFSIDRTKKRMEGHILNCQANELASIFTPIEPPDSKRLPRTERFEDIVPVLPETVICRLKPGTTHARCTVGRGIPNLTSRRYEAPIPVVPSPILELATRAKMICPELEFHLVFKPSWTDVPQLDPILLGKVPGLNEYFEIGSWDGDSVFLDGVLQTRSVI